MELFYRKECIDIRKNIYKEMSRYLKYRVYKNL